MLTRLEKYQFRFEWDQVCYSSPGRGKQLAQVIIICIVFAWLRLVEVRLLLSLHQRFLHVKGRNNPAD
jgi:hypothetical protein